MPRDQLTGSIHIDEGSHNFCTEQTRAWSLLWRSISGVFLPEKITRHILERVSVEILHADDSSKAKTPLIFLLVVSAILPFLQLCM